MNLEALARFRREMLGEQLYGPWDPENDTRDSFTETRDEFSDSLNYLEVFGYQHCVTEADWASLGHIVALVKEADARLCLLHTKSQERKNAESESQPQARHRGSLREDPGGPARRAPGAA